MSERCQKYEGHGGDVCGRTLTGTPESTDPAERPDNWETAGQCPLSWSKVTRGPGVKTWPPEESLCGEEEDLVTGNTPPPPPVPADRWGAGSEAWLRHCQQVGRNRCRAYDEAFGLIEAQLSAFVHVWPELARSAADAEQVAPPTVREVGAAQAFGTGFLGFVGHLRAVTQNVVGGGR